MPYERVIGYERVGVVPGVGAILGVIWFAGMLIAIRSDGEVPVAYVADETGGWEKLEAPHAV